VGGREGEAFQDGAGFIFKRKIHFKIKLCKHVSSTADEKFAPGMPRRLPQVESAAATPFDPRDAVLTQTTHNLFTTRVGEEKLVRAQSDYAPVCIHVLT